MKKFFIVLLLLVTALRVIAQHALSIDVASIRNVKTPINGLNISSFYHFNTHFIGGLEVNRFFPVHHISAGEASTISALDVEVNMHYLLELNKHLKFYPISGISHTSEKESGIEKEETVTESFWSVNTGAGILWELGHWSPHIEYSFCWGQHNQQFLLAGISYEIELGHHHHQK